MGKSIDFNIKFNSNGEAVMGTLTVSAKQLGDAVSAMQKNTKKSFESVQNSMASLTFAFENCARGMQQLAEPAMSFDYAMRAANTS